MPTQQRGARQQPQLNAARHSGIPTLEEGAGTINEQRAGGTEARDLAVTALRAAFVEAIGFHDPIAALDAMEADSRVRVLVTRVEFAPGKPHGVALARMVRIKRPGTRVVFIARAEWRPAATQIAINALHGACWAVAHVHPPLKVSAPRLEEPAGR
jgi:hypothetical protein